MTVAVRKNWHHRNISARRFLPRALERSMVCLKHRSMGWYIHVRDTKKHVKGCHEKKTKKGKRGANSSCHRTGANSLNLMPKRDKIGWNRALYSPNTPVQRTPSSPNDPAKYTSSFSLKMKFRNHDRFRTRCFLALLLMHLLHSVTNITGCRYECNLIKASRRQPELCRWQKSTRTASSGH
jgi:hypothetical protein